ncbi:MAG TPA: peptidylprolyl isomerase [Chloroflexota bacterium]|nr:peptidylprolyl isomerase [Chloroflexota bacterium]
MQINRNGRYTAYLSTSKGEIVIALEPKQAPLAVNNFVFLARHRFFDHIPFWRIIKGFMIQTGDPTGSGTGGPGYSFKIESSGRNFLPGTVAMANTGQPNSNGSQFFICEGSSCANLDSAPPPGYTIFGHVVKGLAVVKAIGSVPTHLGNDGSMSAPDSPVYLNSVRITGPA